MSADDRISRLTLEAQARMFRLAKRDHGLTRKAISLETGVPLPTLKSWESGTMMPLAAVNRLADVMPNYLLSLLTEPGGKRVEDAGDEDDDLDAVAVEASGFVAEYVEAKKDGRVTPIEKARLNHRRRKLKAAA